MTGKVKNPLMLIAGFVALVSAIAVAILVNQSAPRLAAFWILGLMFGFTLSRSRFCFVSGFSNFYLFREGEMLKAIIAGMVVSTIGFAFIMHGWVNDPSTGAIPPGAHVSPFGWYLLPAGLLFGFGMVIAGCCITGSLYRISGGYIYALIALISVLLGMGAFLFTRELWWSDVSSLPQIWLPKYFGWPVAVIFTIFILLAVYLLVVFLQSRRFKTVHSEPATSITSMVKPHFAAKLKSLAKQLITASWPAMAGGILLGVLNTLCYVLVDRPWGVTGEIQRWSQIVFKFAGLPVPEIIPVPGT